MATTVDELAAEQAAIKRRQAIADMLMKQGQEPLETNQVAGGYVVPVSGLSAVDKVVQSLAGAWIGKRGDKAQLDLDKSKLSAERQVLSKALGIPDNNTSNVEKVATGIKQQQNNNPQGATTYAYNDAPTNVAFPQAAPTGQQGISQSPNTTVQYPNTTGQASIANTSNQNADYLDAWSDPNLSDEGKKLVGDEWERYRKKQEPGTSDAYYTNFQTSDGVYSYNNRTGESKKILNADGKAVLPIGADPENKGRMTEATEGEQIKEVTNPDGTKSYYKGKDVLFTMPAPQGSPSTTTTVGAPNTDSSGSGASSNVAPPVVSNVDPNTNTGTPAKLSFGPTTAQTSNTKVDEAGRIAQKNTDIALRKDAELKRQENIFKANKLGESLDTALGYAYPNGVAERDKNGRLIPPKEAALLTNSPMDKVEMWRHDNGLGDSKKAANLIALRSTMKNAVMASVGSLGTGISSTDRDYIAESMGILDKAQTAPDIYNALANIEDRVLKG